MYRFVIANKIKIYIKMCNNLIGYLKRNQQKSKHDYEFELHQTRKLQSKPKELLFWKPNLVF